MNQNGYNYSQFKDKKNVELEVEKIHKLAKKVDSKVCIMEVCGTHTMQIAKYGIRKMMPENIKLVSGPGCPVCVTPQEYVDKAIHILKNYDVVITTFGDLYRVPGTKSSLEKEKVSGKDVRIVYSPYENLEVAKNVSKPVVFLSIGFETTMPAVACVVKETKKRNIKNLFFFIGNKFFLPALETLILYSRNFLSSFIKTDGSIDGFILPGHLSVIVGEKSYSWIVERYNLSGVITGFEPLDIVRGIRMLLEMMVNSCPQIQNEYTRVVSYEGNKYAKEIISEVFEPTGGSWRGLGFVADSNAKLKEEYEMYDAEKVFNVPNIVVKNVDNTKCKCNDVLIGKITPFECPLFGKVCTPENPIGACMVSSEGSCAAYYKYER
jgi:hydrogenase expression/formation protein HypD